ncbi:MAG: RDD family protein [Thermoplasmata archaeon]|nr:MAG: RDD family protein [Thermoplasmata archaeon]
MVTEGINKVLKDQQLRDHWVKRGLAYIIDSVIIVVVMIMIMMLGAMIFIGSVIGGAMTGNPVGGVFGGLLILFIFLLLALIFSVVYWIYFDAKGGTPGKRLMKLKPVALQGEMDYSKATVRNLSKIVGGFVAGLIFSNLILILLVESLIILIDVFVGISRGEDPRRKYTDFMANTTVVRTDISETFIPGAHLPSPAPPAPSAPLSPMPSAIPQAAGIAPDNKQDMIALMDRLLLGEITEEEYRNERRKFTEAT